MKLWIARDKYIPDGTFPYPEGFNGDLFLYGSEPYINKNAAREGIWTCKQEEFIELDYKLFPEVTFENSPQEVELKLINLDNSRVMNDTNVQPEHSYIESVYRCGKKPHWNIGDTLAYYEFYSDREGEYVLGKVTKVKFDEEQCDWFYTFEDGSVYDEQSLLEDETYKKN